MSIRTHRRILARLSGRKKSDGPDAERIEESLELVFNDVSQRADDQQIGLNVVACWHRRNQSREAGIFTLGEGGLDPATRVVEDPDGGFELPRKSLGGTRQIELDHLGRAGPNKKQKLDIRATLEQPGDHLVEFDIGIGQSGEVPLVNDCRGKPGLCKNHHPCGRLNQVGAGPRTHDQKECVLNFAVKPDDAGQAAEDLALAALAQDWDHRAHTAWPRPATSRRATRSSSALAPSRAARSFIRNWVAFTA